MPIHVNDREISDAAVAEEVQHHPAATQDAQYLRLDLSGNACGFSHRVEAQQVR